jgi:hypothetical protein
MFIVPYFSLSMMDAKLTLAMIHDEESIHIKTWQRGLEFEAS